MITVTRWVDNEPALVVRSADDADGSLPHLAPRAWSNGDLVLCSVGHLELAMPRGVWEHVCVEVREVLRSAPPPVLSVVGRNAGDARVYVETTTFGDTAPSWVEIIPGDEFDPGPTLGDRLAALLGMGAGTDEATDDALLDMVGHLKRLHEARRELSRSRNADQVTSAAYTEFLGSL